MSGGDINCLMDLWAASLLKYGDKPPFADHPSLYRAIDSIEHGDVAWECFKASYQGEKPACETPAWMNTEYDVWFRNPRVVVCNMLKNVDFEGKIDYSPVQDFNNDDERQYQNLMSGEWAWQQAVRTCLLLFVSC